MNPQSIPLACDMSAFTETQRQHHSEVAQQLFAQKQSVRELADGYSLQFADDPAIYLLTAEFMSLEHRCCPFFRLALEAEPGGDEVTLRITGVEGVKEFVRTEVSGWIVEGSSSVRAT